jgi:hypothetical protein
VARNLDVSAPRNIDGFCVLTTPPLSWSQTAKSLSSAAFPAKAPLSLNVAPKSPSIAPVATQPHVPVAMRPPNSPPPAYLFAAHGVSVPPGLLKGPPPAPPSGSAKRQGHMLAAFGAYSVGSSPPPPPVVSEGALPQPPPPPPPVVSEAALPQPLPPPPVVKEAASPPSAAPSPPPPVVSEAASPPLAKPLPPPPPAPGVVPPLPPPPPALGVVLPASDVARASHDASRQVSVLQSTVVLQPAKTVGLVGPKRPLFATGGSVEPPCKSGRKAGGKVKAQT